MIIESSETYSLNFSKLTLDFDLDVNESVDMTSRFGSHSQEFAFAVAETWLRTPADSYLIIPSIRPANFIEELTEYYRVCETGALVNDFAKIIEIGGWSKWMGDYWKRVDEETEIPEDETSYKYLMGCLLFDSREGHVVIYIHSGDYVVEVGVRTAGRPTGSFWSGFEPVELSTQVLLIRDQITARIHEGRAAMGLP